MARIIGWGHTPFGKRPDSIEDLIQAAGREALDHCGLAPAEVDAVFVGHFNSGMVPDGFVSSMALGIHPDLRFAPATRLENACASGSAAVFAALNAVAAGQARVALVIGVEKMTHLSTADVTRGLAGSSYQPEETGVSFPQVFARYAQAYRAKHGDPVDAMARIAVKNHANALQNPLAQMHKALGYEFCATPSDRNPVIADPLKVSDCSLISDGAAALVIAAPDVDAPQAVAFRGRAQVNDLLPLSRKDLTEIAGARRAVGKALEEAGVTIADIGAAEVHDCFTIAELLMYEAMGLAEPGQGGRLIADGTVAHGGALPVNLSGGLKAKGHPVGATGVSMHVLAARQVTGTAGGMQAPGCALSLVVNMGGSGVANYASVLEAA